MVWVKLSRSGGGKSRRFKSGFFCSNPLGVRIVSDDALQIQSVSLQDAHLIGRGNLKASGKQKINDGWWLSLCGHPGKQKQPTKYQCGGEKSLAVHNSSLLFGYRVRGTMFWSSFTTWEQGSPSGSSIFQLFGKAGGRVEPLGRTPKKNHPVNCLKAMPLVDENQRPRKTAENPLSRSTSDN